MSCNDLATTTLATGLPWRLTTAASGKQPYSRLAIRCAQNLYRYPLIWFQMARYWPISTDSERAKTIAIEGSADQGFTVQVRVYPPTAFVLSGGVQENVIGQA